jgi:hypothetical protein
VYNLRFSVNAGFSKTIMDDNTFEIERPID